jgi:phosphatidylinositol kinase/protein kinase (PI-3  family)
VLIVTTQVPEVVPLRLTFNLLGALRPRGVEGHFRVAAEGTLPALRGAKEVLLLLLLEVRILSPACANLSTPRANLRVTV